MKTKNYLLLLIVCIITMGCSMKQNNGINEINLRDKYEFDYSIASKPIILEDNKSGTVRLAFIKYGEADENSIYEVIVYNTDGKQYNRNKMKFSTKDEVYLCNNSLESLDRDGADAILLYDTFGRGWIFDQDGNKIKSYRADEIVDKTGVVLNLYRDEIDNEKIVVVTTEGSWGDNKGKWFVDVIKQRNGKSLNSYPLIFEEDDLKPIPVVIDNNMYVVSRSTDPKLDGYAINGAKRLPGFPIDMKWLDMDWLDRGGKYIGLYRSDSGFVFPGGKNNIYRFHLKDKKVETIEVKGSKSIDNVKTGYVNGNEYIYAFDKNDNCVYKINNKNKVKNTMKISGIDSCELEYFNTFSLKGGEETYLFFIYSERKSLDIEKLFEKYAPAGEGKRIEEYAYSRIKEFNKVKVLNKELMDVAKRLIVNLKEEYLQDRFDLYVNQDILSQADGPQVTKVIIFKDVKEEIKQIVKDEILDYEFAIFFGEIQEIYPSIYFNNKLNSLSFIAPFNKGGYGSDIKDQKSIIKVYKFDNVK